MLGRRSCQRLGLGVPLALALALAVAALVPPPVRPPPARLSSSSPPISTATTTAMTEIDGLATLPDDRSSEVAVTLAAIRLPPPPAVPGPKDAVSETSKPERSKSGESGHAPSPPAPSPPAPTTVPAPAPAPLDGTAETPIAGDPDHADRPPVTDSSPRDLAAGEAALQAIEAGEGPGLVLTWPTDAGSRRRIAAYLARCAGLTVALLAEGQLWRLQDPAGQAWRPDPLAVSTIVRRADGIAPGLANRLRSRHGIEGGSPVAVVARRYDARLLGGLARLAPLGGRIRAAYAARDGVLLVTAVRIDDAAIDGTLRLARLDRCG